MDLNKKDNETFNNYFGRLAKIQAELIKDKDANEETIKKINEIVYSYAPFRQYVDAYCRSSWKTYYAKYKNEMIISGYEEFLRNFHKFDSSKAELITFSKLHILHGVQGFLAYILNKRTIFEKEIAANVDVIKATLLKQGFSEDEITPSIVHTYLPKYAYSQIAAALSGGIQLQSLADTDLDLIGQKGHSAENEYIKKLAEEETSGIFKSLPKYEIFLLQCIDSDNTALKSYNELEENETFLSLIKECGLSKYIKTRNDKEYVSSTDIKKMFVRAKNHVFRVALEKSDRYRNSKEKYGRKNNDYIDFGLYEQAVNNEKWLMGSYITKKETCK